MPGELNRTILRLAVPNLLAAISVPLIGIVDTAMIGHLPEVAFMGAVASASAIFDILYWGTGFLRMGTTSIVSQYSGAGDRRACAEALYRALILAVLLAVALLALRRWIGWAGFELAGGSPEVREWGRRYFEVRVVGVPLVLVTYVLHGFFLGTANALAPMVMTVAANLVNALGDYALIYGMWGAPALGVVGAAWAAVLGNGVAAGIGLAVLVTRYRPYLAERPHQLLDRERLRHLVATNFHLFGRTSCLLATQFSMLAIASRLGEVPLAAHAVVWQIWALVSFGVDGFAHAAETLVGNCLGAADFAGARRVARRILAWGISIGAVLAIVYAVALGSIAAAFTEHAEVVQAAASLSLIVALVQPMNAAVFVFDGIFIGANDVAYLFAAMAVAAFGFFVPAAAGLVYGLGLGLPGAWLAYDGLMLGRFLTLLARYRGDAWLRSFTRPRRGL
ncbi:MAG: MATE family efflux transporter [Gemmatimonadota bacterium]